MYNYLKHNKKVADLENCDIEKLIEEESFENNLLEYPQYTRPQDFRGKKVPEVLVSGNHALIDKWRKEEAIKLTRKKRPDLYRKYKRALEKENKK